MPSGSQAIRDNVMEILSGVKGENSIKIIGPDLQELERVANKAAGELSRVRGAHRLFDGRTDLGTRRRLWRG